MIYGIKKHQALVRYTLVLGIKYIQEYILIKGSSCEITIRLSIALHNVFEVSQWLSATFLYMNTRTHAQVCIIYRPI